MKRTKIAAVIIATLVTGAAAQAQASVITYDLTDTPIARTDLQTGGFYQRVGGASDFQSLSLEQAGADAKFTYDTVTGAATLSGTALNLDTGGLFSFELNYDDTTLVGNSLTLGDMTTVGAFGGTTVNGKGFNLTLGDTLTGDGWLTNSGTGTHFGDFHFAGVKVPNGGGGQVSAPGSLALIGAMGLLGAWRRKRHAKS